MNDLYKLTEKELVVTNGTDLVTNSIGHQFIKNQNVVSLYQIHKKRKMKKRHIAHTIDLLFCLVIIPLSVMLLPVDRWIAHNTAFLFTLIAYVYALYFVYRKACLPKLFLEKKIPEDRSASDCIDCPDTTAYSFSYASRRYY